MIVVDEDVDVAVAFTSEHVMDKSLVIAMLRDEDAIMHSDQAMDMYANPQNFPRESLTVEHAIHRMVLRRFGFMDDDPSVLTYRTICRTYYRGPHDYDPDVLGAVTYMRENKILYYTEPPLRVGDEVDTLLSDTPVVDFMSDSGSSTSIADVVAQHTKGGDWEHLFIGGFSTT